MGLDFLTAQHAFLLSRSPPFAGLRCRKGRTKDHQGTSPGGTREPDKVLPPQSGNVRGLCMCVHGCVSVCGHVCMHMCASLCVHPCVCMCVCPFLGQSWRIPHLQLHFFFDLSLSTSQLCTGDTSVSLCSVTCPHWPRTCAPSSPCAHPTRPLFPKAACF